MCFFTDNLEYIDKCAGIHAQKIDVISGRRDYEDNKQEMLFYVWRFSARFDGTKANPHTFISRMICAKEKLILRQYRRKKNIIQTQSVPINHA